MSENLGTVFAGFDGDNGFTITNNTEQNIYLQTSATAFEQIASQATSTPHKAYYNYTLRSNNNTTAPVYLTINVSSADGSVNVVSGTQRAIGGVLVSTFFT